MTITAKIITTPTILLRFTISGTHIDYTPEMAAPVAERLAQSKDPQAATMRKLLLDYIAYAKTFNPPPSPRASA